MPHRTTARLLLLAVALSLDACSTSGASDGGDAAAEGGACLATGNVCGRNAVCIGGDCGGNCCTGGCVGPDDASVCTAPNVSFATSCAPSCTGGDPTGTWHLAGACAGGPSCPNLAAGSGVVGPVGTLVVGTSSNSYLPLGEAFGACSRWTTSNGGGLSGSYDPDAGTVSGDRYCVQGGALYLFVPPDPNAGSDPRITALQLVR